MERKNIAFQYGIHRSPSAANEGELAECVNLEVHNGELTPSVMPEIAFTLSDGDKLLFVHKSGSYKNFIIQRGASLCWFPDKDKTKVTPIKEITPTSIHAVGNTLIVLSKDRMEYILFKSETYKPIGSKPPFCSISFGLVSTSPVGTQISVRGNFTIKGDANLMDTRGFISGLETYFKEGKMPDDVSFSDLYSLIETDEVLDFQGERYVEAMTESAAALTNDFIADQSKFSKFTGSFFLRYAYRMYDGSHCMHSAPVFFPINTEGPLLIPTNVETVDSYDKKVSLKLLMNVSSVHYQVVGYYDSDGNNVDSGIMDDWKDIVQGIDIFATKQIYKHRQSGYVWGYSDKSGIYEKSVSSISTAFKRSASGDYGYSPYKTQTYKDEFGNYASLSFTFQENEDYINQIKNASSFFKVSELKDFTEDFESRAQLPIKENILSNLEQQEVLEDDYDSHNTIIPSFAHVYNGRLNISGIRTRLFNGYPMESMVPYTYNPDGGNSTWTIKTRMEIEGGTVEVVSKSNIELYENPAYLYYPSPKVEEFTSYRYDSHTDNSVEPPAIVIRQAISTFKPEVHKLLNGSFYLSPSFGISDEYIFGMESVEPMPSGNPYVDYPNKIYTSEINNPFFFPLSGRNSIGTGTIIAITSNTKAISPGQFGQYPLIVFSTDGVWAMQTGEDGLYYSVHPISKDICTNPNVLQTDGPVLFVTENGLHSIVGETVENISNHMKGKPESMNLPEVDEAFTAIAGTAKDTETFNLFIRNANFAYDYANSRVLAYSEEKDFAYVLSTESGTISKLVLLKESSPVRMGSAINAYPEVYMQSGSDIYTFVPDLDTTGEIMKGLLVTRTMSFSDPLAMKIVNDVKLIYHRTEACSRCRYAMFVSNDGLRWGQCNSLRSRSYKFFRFAVFTELADTDALQGMSVMLDYRRTNKLR